MEQSFAATQRGFYPLRLWLLSPSQLFPNRGFALLANEPSLFEAEITGAAGGRRTDNHVIHLLDLQEPGPIRKPVSQVGICFGRRTIPPRVVA
jgi:hypothetical protein